jgi:hypothetical protein
MKRLLLFLVVATTIATQATTQTAVIREMTGTVETKTSGAADWTPAKAGDVVERSTMVSTGFRSTAILTVGSSTITVLPLTRLTLEEIIKLDESETVNLNLSSGRVRVEVKPPAGSKANFSVQTPSATASVRGTSFEMDTQSIRGLTGAVSFAPVTNTARPVIVNAKRESWVNTETGNAESTFVASQILRPLPDLPGQDAGFGSNTPIVFSGVYKIEVKFEK